MKKTLFNICIVILVIIVFFILSINFIFKIPSPMGGYEVITYKVGLRISVIAGAITAILLFIFNKPKKQ